MPSVRTLLAVSSALLLAACFTEQPGGEYDLDVSPFANAHISRDQATMEIVLLDGYVCPDGAAARVYYVEPVGVPGPRPLGVVLHGGNFDYVTEGGRRDHYAPENRLAAGWANAEAEVVLGLVQPGAGPDVEGAWTGAFLLAGFSVVVPANCWGDLWHGTGDGDWSGEGFLRQGAYFVDDAIAWAQAREDIDAASTVVVGLGEGGRGITELAYGVDGSSIVAPAAVAVDSSPDWLAGLVASPATNADYLTGLARLYEAELTDDGDAQLRQNELRDALERDSLVTVVENGWRTPIFYAWSAYDERIDPAAAQPAQGAISTHYDLNDHVVVDWGVPGHAPSNRDLAEATARLDWLRTHLP